MQNCSNSIALAMELLQSCTKLSRYEFWEIDIGIKQEFFKIDSYTIHALFGTDNNTKYGFSKIHDYTIHQLCETNNYFKHKFSEKR